MRGAACFNAAVAPGEFAARLGEGNNNINAAVALGVANNIGGMDQSCAHCGARKYLNESISCCNQGTIHIPPPPPIPDELRRLIDAESDIFSSAHHAIFKNKARSINNAMAFAYAKIKRNVLQPRVQNGATNAAPGYMTLGDTMTYQHGPILPTQWDDAGFTQLYFCEGRTAGKAAEKRRASLCGQPGSRTKYDTALMQNDRCIELLTSLEAMIARLHPFHEMVRRALDVWRQTLPSQRPEAEIVFLSSDGNMRGDFGGAWDNPTGNMHTE